MVTPRAAALAEFTAIVRDVAGLPGRRDAQWWSEVRDAVCAKHGVADLRGRGGGRTAVPLHVLLARRWAS